jgi:hypothetical protein
MVSHLFKSSLLLFSSVDFEKEKQRSWEEKKSWVGLGFCSKSDCFLLLFREWRMVGGKRNHLIGFDVFMQPHVLARLRRPLSV